jgi:hypothetical protein
LRQQIGIADYSKAVRAVAADRLRHFIEQAAIITADEVKLVINESVPEGRHYSIPGTAATYQASAPGQPPAIREGHYIESIKSTPAVTVGKTIEAFAYTDRTVGRSGEHILGDLLEHGTPTMGPRPHWRPAIRRARKKILALGIKAGVGGIKVEHGGRAAA